MTKPRTWPNNALWAREDATRAARRILDLTERIDREFTSSRGLNQAAVQVLVGKIVREASAIVTDLTAVATDPDAGNGKDEAERQWLEALLALIESNADRAAVAALIRARLGE